MRLFNIKNNRMIVKEDREERRKLNKKREKAVRETQRERERGR